MKIFDPLQLIKEPFRSNIEWPLYSRDITTSLPGKNGPERQGKADSQSIEGQIRLTVHGLLSV